jgi:hypothetical protein
MKSAEEIQTILVSELQNSVDKIKAINRSFDYYNEILGATPYLLAGLLGILLKNKFKDWDSRKWMDDSLITKVRMNENKISIWGVMIWGLEDITEQWTEPFYFEIELDKNGFNKYIFLFSDLENPEITYEDFRQNRNYWGNEYFKNNNWDPSEKNWKYIIPG